MLNITKGRLNINKKKEKKENMTNKQIKNELIIKA